MKKNVKQLLPKGSRELITKALKSYQYALEVIGNGFDDNMNREHFDCYGLIGMMNYDVEITLSEEDVEDFGQHNVDFPEFGEVKRMYPDLIQEVKIVNYTIKKEVFLNWYFTEYKDYAEIGETVAQKLINDEEKFTVEYSIMEIFDSCNHEIVPVGLTEECEGFGDKELGELDGHWNLTLI
jgi:hypothetical protein